MYLRICALCLLNYCFFGVQGSKRRDMFWLKGKDLLMEIKGEKTNDTFLWKLKINPTRTRIIINHPPTGLTDNKFGERAVFATGNYSLLMKDIGLNESGCFEAVSKTETQERLLFEYCITVQEQASPVVLDVQAVSLSPESCNVTVKCSTNGSSVISIFTCTNQTCSGDGVKPAEVASNDLPLHLYLSDDSIAICNHSNQVSWSNDTLGIIASCSPNADNQVKVKVVSFIIMVTVGLLFVFVMVVMVVVVVMVLWWKKKNCEVHSPRNDDQSPNCDQSTIYSLLGHASVPQPSHPTHDSTYAMVHKPNHRQA